jgi:hypothetical protein
MVEPPLNLHIAAREYEKFGWDAELGTVVKVLTKIFGGELTIISPVDFYVSTELVTSTPAQFPSVMPANAVAMDFVNLSETDIVYSGRNNSVTADRTVGSNGGWEIGPGEGDNFSLGGGNRPWLVTPSGKTAVIKVRVWTKSP